MRTEKGLDYLLSNMLSRIISEFYFSEFFLSPDTYLPRVEAGHSSKQRRSKPSKFGQSQTS